MSADFDFDQFEKMFADTVPDVSSSKSAFSQSEIDKMNMDHMKHGDYTLAIPKRTQTLITNEHELSQFAGPRRNNRARAKPRKNYCDNCDAPMEKDQLDSGVTGYICHTCGKEGDYCYDSFVDDVDRTSTGNDSSTYNTYSSSSVPLTITGPGGYLQRRGIISGNASYKKAQEKTTRSQFQQILLSSDIGRKIPQEVSREAENLFLRIQAHKILRASRRRGTMAACLDVKCRSHEMPRKCKEISEMFDITRGMLSCGHGILDELVESGLIEAQYKASPDAQITAVNGRKKDNPVIVGYINRYFEGLGIPLDDGYGYYDNIDAVHLEEIMDDDDYLPSNGHPNYKRFALDLIRFTQTFKIADTSMDSSKCAGTIYILSIRVDDLEIPIEDIEKECDISKTTFCKFSKEVDRILNTDHPNYKKTKRKLRHLFKKYDIPLS
jgi:hypothetical protein